MNAMKTLAAAVLLAVAAAGAQAGRDCEAKPARAQAVQRSLDLALKTSQALDTSGARVVLLARAGQDLSRWGLRWSHLGFAYRSEAGPWRVVHKLNACGSPRADLYRQGLGEFFLDDPHEYRAAWLVLSPELQARLHPLLTDDQRVAAMHEASYNMVAYPWATRYQQSNQWAIETLALAADAQAARPGQREHAQAWLKWQGYEPSTLQIGALERLGAGVSRANIAFDDHPTGQRMAGRIATVTVDSVFRWLPQRGLAQAAQELSL
jgi:hypothetical protein